MLPPINYQCEYKELTDFCSWIILYYPISWDQNAKFCSSVFKGGYF